MTKIQQVLAENLRKFRKIRGFTQEQLAEKAGTSTNYIGTIEIGKKYPSPQMLEKLAEALEIDSLMFFQCESKNEKDSILKQKLETVKSNLINDFAKFVENEFK
ncbi:MAG: helix-turn-helix transcriptional regulator [Treponema sp.]|nr:helix-turn-helix transcriptional regulator [Candidatus Treponema equifaecale]